MPPTPRLWFASLEGVVFAVLAEFMTLVERELRHEEPCHKNIISDIETKMLTEFWQFICFMSDLRCPGYQ